MKSFFNRILNELVSLRLHRLAALAAAVVVTVKDRRFTVVRWDGQDWAFIWSGGCLFWTSPLLSPKRITHRNIQQYLARYSPKHGDVILDVGAGVGTEVCLFSDMVGPSGTVIAIEADPVAARLLRKQADHLPHRNVRVVEVAVGKEEGSVQLSVAEPGAVQNSVAAIVGSDSIAVRSEPLANILRAQGLERVSYMKVNIEGAEYDALLSLGPAVEKIERMCVSCHDFTGVPGQRTYDRVLNYLTSRSFRITKARSNPQAPWEDYYIFAEQAQC